VQVPPGRWLGGSKGPPRLAAMKGKKIEKKKILKEVTIL
jgi:hypothetical protein